MSAATIDEALRQRPLVVAVAGSNGAGKSTFVHSQLSSSGLRFVNADELAIGLELEAYHAAEIAARVRETLIAARESFIFETVFSDPVGDKVAQLEALQQQGYTVVLIFIGIDSVATSQTRVAMRVSQGGHDIPDDKLAGRYPRTLANLARAIERLPYVLIYDNSDLASPYRRVGVAQHGALELTKDPPAWVAELAGRSR